MRHLIEPGSKLPTVFSYDESNKLRSINEHDHPWFAAIDICSILGLTNSRVVISRLYEDELRKFNLRGKHGETWFVNESGLYNLILRSDKPQAKQFRKWVTNEVLPTLRKTGSYSTSISGDFKGLFPKEIQGKFYYDYVKLLTRCGYSTSSGSRSSRRRKNPQEFTVVVDRLNGFRKTTMVSLDYAAYLVQSSRMRDERARMVERRERFLSAAATNQLNMFQS